MKDGHNEQLQHTQDRLRDVRKMIENLHVERRLLLKKLSDIQKNIRVHRYVIFLDLYESGLTLAEIAKQKQLSQTRVKQIIDKAREMKERNTI